MAKPNILLIVLDSVRARNCGLYDHENRTTPFLSEFANTATVFEQARSPSIQSISSHASIFSGYHTYQHQLHDFESYLDPNENIWHELSKEYGYETGMFSSNSIVTQSSNLSSVFDTLVGPKQTRSDVVLFESGLSPKDFPDTNVFDFLNKSSASDAPLRSFLNGVYYTLTMKETGAYNPEKERAEVYVDNFLKWLAERNNPWGACINFMDAHIPYIPEEEHNQWGDEFHKQIHDRLDFTKNIDETTFGRLQAVQSLYDGCIRQLDAALERLLTEMGARGVLDDTLVVITSDHGEAFGERSSLVPSVRVFGHNHGIHEVLTHVPLIIKEPGQSDSVNESRVATLTNFPSVVQAAIRGNVAHSEFLPNRDFVLSSCDRPVSSEHAPTAQDFPDTGLWQAVYTDIEGDMGVLKHSSWGEKSASRHIRSAQVAYDVHGNAAEIVDKVYDDLDTVDIKRGSVSERRIDDGVKDRLADLGYVD